MASVTQDAPVTNVNKIRQNANGQFSKEEKGRHQKPSKLENRPDQQTSGSTSHKPCKFCGKKHGFK